jgi:hypothetical protein
MGLWPLKKRQQLAQVRFDALDQVGIFGIPSDTQGRPSRESGTAIARSVNLPYVPNKTLPVLFGDLVYRITNTVSPAELVRNVPENLRYGAN